MQKSQEWGRATLLQMGCLERAFLWRGRARASVGDISNAKQKPRKGPRVEMGVQGRPGPDTSLQRHWISSL